MIKFSDLEGITGGTVLNSASDPEIHELVLDSRKLNVTSNALFFAIKGVRNDGHDFVETLYRHGIRSYVVEKAIPLPGPDANLIRVKSSVEALQNIATYHRNSFNIPVIGVTGSNGKTITKEWIYQLLSQDYNCVKTPGSYNSQIGVPLSVWQIQSIHQLGIFEAGISKPGEMANLAKVIQPTIGIFTNIGSAHDEGFFSLTEKIQEKLKLFANSSIVLYCHDHERIRGAIEKEKLHTLSWGFNGGDIRVQVDRHWADLVYAGKSFRLNLPFADQASIENALHGVALLLHLGLNESQIQERLTRLQSVPRRLELKAGINNTYIIDDTYNNDLGGLKIALDFLRGQRQKTSKRIILSDIEQSGLGEYEITQQVAAVINHSGVNLFVGVGPVIGRNRDLIKVPSEFYDSTEQFLSAFVRDTLHDEIVLVKGGRRFKFEKIVAALQQKVHGTVVEIDLDAMVSNLNYFKAKLNHGTKVMAMVKAFAYGSGSSEVASLLQYHRVDYLGVAYADEGVDLRKNNITIPIMVMNPTSESIDVMLSYKLEPEIYSFMILESLIKSIDGRACKIHIKVDTGMHRLGFELGDADNIVSILRVNKHLSVASIFTHLAGADEVSHDDYSAVQVGKFLLFADRLSKQLGYKPIYHVLNSPGILRLPQYQFDMVRLGIGLYGIDPTENRNHHLRPVATLKTIVSQVRKISKGETIGYGRRGVAEKDMSIATIAIGYADGYNRAFSRGVGEVLINQQRAKVVGNVCMDMTMVDVTGVDVQEGDEVIIFGPQLPIEDVASMIHTIPYEVLTNTSDRVKRVFLAESI